MLLFFKKCSAQVDLMNTDLKMKLKKKSAFKFESLRSFSAFFKQKVFNDMFHLNLDFFSSVKTDSRFFVIAILKMF